MKKNNKEIIINILYIIMEIIGITHSSIVLQRFALEYYTEDSNLFALIIGVIYLYYLLSNKKIPKGLSILRLSSVIGLCVTFLVVLFVLMPMLNFNPWLFMGANFFLHLACPVVLFYLYMFIDKKVKFNKKEVLMAVVPSFIYSGIILIFNIFKIIEGPYPFLYVYKQPIIVSIFWCVTIIGSMYFISYLLNKIRK